MDPEVKNNKPSSSPEINRFDLQKVFDQAVLYTAAQFCCGGVPERNKIAYKYSRASLEERKKGFDIRPLDLSPLFESSDTDLTEEDRELAARQIQLAMNTGQSVETLRSSVQHVPYVLLSKIEGILREGFGIISKLCDSFESQEGSHLLATHEANLYLPDPHTISWGQIFNQGTEEVDVKKFHDYLRDIGTIDISHTGIARSIENNIWLTKTRGSVEAMLTICTNGSFVFSLGRHRSVTYNNPDSQVEIRTDSSLINSSVVVSNIHNSFLAYPIKLGDSYVSESGVVEYKKRYSRDPLFSLVSTTIEAIPEDVLKEGNFLRNDARFSFDHESTRCYHSNYRRKGDELFKLRSGWSSQERLEKLYNRTEKGVLLVWLGHPSPVERITKEVVFIHSRYNYSHHKPGSILSTEGDNYSEAEDANLECAIHENGRPRVCRFQDLNQLL